MEFLALEIYPLNTPTKTMSRRVSGVLLSGGLLKENDELCNWYRDYIDVTWSHPGPMFSGKTTELMRRMRRFQVANHACYMIKYSGDDRYSEESVATHDRQVTAAVSAKTLSKLKNKALQYGVIGIDEGQFFPDVVAFCEDMANAGKTVIVAALDGTFQRKPFGSILSLVPLAESVVKLKAVCMVCYRDAAFTKRLGSEKEVEVIGGAEKYMAVCRTCYSLPDRQTLMKNNVTPIRGNSDITIGRHLDLESPIFD